MLTLSRLAGNGESDDRGRGHQSQEDGEEIADNNPCPEEDKAETEQDGQDQELLDPGAIGQVLRNGSDCCAEEHLCPGAEEHLPGGHHQWLVFQIDNDLKDTQAQNYQDDADDGEEDGEKNILKTIFHGWLLNGRATGGFVKPPPQITLWVVRGSPSFMSRGITPGGNEKNEENRFGGGHATAYE
jgi:hypothetical protein